MEHYEIEMLKAAEAAEALDAEGLTFASEADALEAVQQVIDDDYAEKIGSVCEEFEADEVEFDSEEEKVAAAMEIVDGYEEAMAKEAATKKRKAAIAASAIGGAGASHALLSKGRGYRAAWKAHQPAAGAGKVKSILGRIGATAKHNPYKGASKKRIAAMIGGTLAGGAGAGYGASRLKRGE